MSYVDTIHKFYHRYENLRALDYNKVNDTSRVLHSDLDNDTNKFQIHNFGCSFTYGYGVDKEESFPYLLHDNEYSSFNHGIRGIGMDMICQKVSMIYNEYKLRNNKDFLFIITLPHIFRRVIWAGSTLFFAKPYEVAATGISDEEQYLYFYHQYMMLNNLIGREHILWSTWGKHKDMDSEVPASLVDTQIDCIDYAPDDNHPGVESHKEYAKRLKHLIKVRRRKL